MNLFETDKCIPVCLPHYEIVNDDLVFMKFRKKNLAAELVGTFAKINNSSNLEILMKKGVRKELIQQLIDKKCVILVNSVEKHISAERILILAPHVDDTAFALGGYVSKYIGEKNFYIVNVFGKQDYTLYWNNYESSRKKAYPQEEERIFCRAANIEQMYLWDYPDAPLRKLYQHHSYMNTSDSTGWIIQQEASLLRQITASINKVVNEIQPDYVFCPLGIGKHVDHILVRQACFNLKLPCEKMLFYEDMPYSISFNRVNVIEEIQKIYNATLIKEECDITLDIKRKRDFVNIYQSQLMGFQMKAIIDYSIRGNENEKIAVENLWKFS